MITTHTALSCDTTPGTDREANNDEQGLELNVKGSQTLRIIPRVMCLSPLDLISLIAVLNVYPASCVKSSVCTVGVCVLEMRYTTNTECQV